MIAAIAGRSYLLAALALALGVMAGVTNAQQGANGNFNNGLDRLFNNGASNNGTASALQNLIAGLFPQSTNSSRLVLDLLAAVTKPNTTAGDVAAILTGSGALRGILNGLNRNATDVIEKAVKDLQKQMEGGLPATPQEFIDLVSLMTQTDMSFFTNMANIQEMLANTVAFVEATVSKPCLNATTTFAESIGQGKMWALKMLDSFGKPESGILTGKLIWVGSYQECIDLTSDVIQKETPDVVEFNGQFCTPGLPIGMGTFAAGVCLPDICSQIEKTIIVNSGLSIVASVALQLQGQNSTVVEAQMRCQERPENVKLDTNAFVAITVIAVIAFFIAIGTIVDIVAQTVEKQRESQEKTADGVELVHQNGVTNLGYASETDVELAYRAETDANGKAKHPPTDGATIVTSDSTTKIVGNDITNEKQEPGVVFKLFESLSIYTSSKKMFGTKQPAGALGCLNGIRFLSMSWVILGHTLALSPFPYGLVGNYNDVFGLTKTFQFQAVVNATVSVDTFFVLGGVLVTYLSLRLMKKKKGFGPLDWALFYFHRYWRLTPPLMLCIMVYHCLLRFFGSGPFWYGEGDQTCGTKWWENLLYVQNLVSPDTQCFGWAWYLANDMQFFCISPIFLFLLYKWPKIGIASCAVGAVGSIVATGVISSVYKLGPGSMLSAEGQTTPGDIFKLIYVVPWTRVGAYMVGVVTGYLLYEYKGKVKMHWATACLGWMVATAFCVSTLYGLYGPMNGPLLSVEISAFYNAMFRVVWSLGIGWLIFACCTGYGGILNEFLSWRAFVPLSRLTYCAYLIHPMVMSTFYATQVQLIYLTYTNMIFYNFAFLAVSYMFAYVTSLFFESPWLGIEKVLLGKLMKKKGD